MQKIVVLDGYVTNPGDLSWNDLYAIGDVIVYDHTSYEEIVRRALGVEAIITNKCIIDKGIIDQLPHLKYLGLLATGFDNVNVSYAQEKGITVTNAVGYGSASVAQHVMALILSLTNGSEGYSLEVHEGGWSKRNVWSYWDRPIVELEGKVLGIYGLGSIGSRVAHIGLAMGMQVIATRRNRSKPAPAGIEIVGEDVLWGTSDIISLHAPLTVDNKGVINRYTLGQMKPTAYLINTGRGGLVDEGALAEALHRGDIAGAGLDVLSTEPPMANHVLIGAPNCILTPHQAWAAKESRERLVKDVILNVEDYLQGQSRNVVRL